jgi:hypothetical protein
MVSRKLVNGILLVDPEAVPKVCHSCVYGQQHCAPFPSPTNKIRAQKPGIFFHNDLSGKNANRFSWTVVLLYPF